MKKAGTWVAMFCIACLACLVVPLALVSQSKGAPSVVSEQAWWRVQVPIMDNEGKDRVWFTPNRPIYDAVTGMLQFKTADGKNVMVDVNAALVEQISKPLEYTIVLPERIKTATTSGTLEFEQ